MRCRLFRLVPALLLAGLAGALPARAQDCAGRLFDGEGILGAPVCLPEKVERIVVLDPTFSLGMTLELGMPVVAAPLTGMSDAALKDRAQAAGVADIGWFLEPSAEAIVAARPDVILGSSLAESFLPMLQQVAPTVLIGSPDWRDYYRDIARLGGKEAELEALMRPLDARIAEMRARVPETVISILRITSWDFQVYLDGPNVWAPFALLHELGVHRSAYEMEADPSGLKRPDWEELAALDGERLFYIIGGSNGSATNGRWQEVSGNPLWQMLPAVQAGQVRQLDYATWMEFSGIASANRVLDDVERLVIGGE